MKNKNLENLIYILLILFTPLFVTQIINGRQIDSMNKLCKLDTGKDVLIQGENANILVDVEQYMLGVLPDIVECNNSDKYIEAQVVAIRTNIYALMGENNIINAAKLPYTYKFAEEYMERWGSSKYRVIEEKFIKAIINTEGKIIE